MDMEEMIKDCESRKTENEVVVFGIGAGRMIPTLFMPRKVKRAMKEAIEYIQTLEGFIGVHPIDEWHTILVFNTLNNAKYAKNKLQFNECPVGNIAPMLIKKEYANGKL